MDNIKDEKKKTMTDEEIQRINQERINQLNEKVEEIKERQESELTYDFDEALKEYAASKNKLTIRFLGKIYELSSRMPFNFSTFFLRYCYKKIDGKMVVILPEDKVLRFIELMFGREFLTALERSNNVNVSLDFVTNNIIPNILNSWGYETNSKNKAELEKKVMTRGF